MAETNARNLMKNVDDTMVIFNKIDGLTVILNFVRPSYIATFIQFYSILKLMMMLFYFCLFRLLWDNLQTDSLLIIFMDDHMTTQPPIYLGLR